MRTTVAALISDAIWKPLAKNMIAGIIGAAVAYAVDRNFFDAQLAHELANALMNIVHDVLK